MVTGENKANQTINWFIDIVNQSFVEKEGKIEYSTIVAISLFDLLYPIEGFDAQKNLFPNYNPIIRDTKSQLDTILNEWDMRDPSGNRILKITLLMINGHASKPGTKEQNSILSQQRAEAVYNYILSKKGEKNLTNLDIDKTLLWFYGEERPHVYSINESSNVQEDSPFNRRVEIEFKLNFSQAISVSTNENSICYNLWEHDVSGHQLSLGKWGAVFYQNGTLKGYNDNGNTSKAMTVIGVGKELYSVDIKNKDSNDNSTSSDSETSAKWKKIKSVNYEHYLNLFSDVMKIFRAFMLPTAGNIAVAILPTIRMLSFINQLIDNIRTTPEGEIDSINDGITVFDIRTNYERFRNYYINIVRNQGVTENEMSNEILENGVDFLFDRGFALNAELRDETVLTRYINIVRRQAEEHGFQISDTEIGQIFDSVRDRQSIEFIGDIEFKQKVAKEIEILEKIRVFLKFFGYSSDLHTFETKFSTSNCHRINDFHWAPFFLISIGPQLAPFIIGIEAQLAFLILGPKNDSGETDWVLDIQIPINWMLDLNIPKKYLVLQLSYGKTLIDN